MHGVYLLFWVQEKQVSPAVIAAAVAASDLALGMFEIPTGWVADRWGPRASLLTGSLVQVVGMLACWLAPGLFSVVAGSMIIALGDAFRSGADQALLYRTCVALGRVDEFRRIEARTHAATQVALVLLVVAGGAIVQRWGFAVGWLAETLLCAAGAVIAMMMMAPPKVRDGGTTAEAAGAQGSWRLLRSGHLLRTVLPASLIGAAASAASFAAQTSVDASPATVTWLVATLALLEAGGSVFASAPQPLLRSRVLVASTAAVIGTVIWRPTLISWAALALAVLHGASYPGRAAAIQTLATDSIRARAASLASACDMAVSAIALPLTGYFQGRRIR